MDQVPNRPTAWRSSLGGIALVVGVTAALALVCLLLAALIAAAVR